LWITAVSDEKYPVDFSRQAIKSTKLIDLWGGPSSRDGPNAPKIREM
jgi:hypothetical protein